MKTKLFLVLFFAGSMFMSVLAENNLPSDTTSQVSKDSVKSKPRSRVDENGIWFAPDQLPQFKGGTQAMLEYLSANIHRPAGLDSIKGYVSVRFVVTKKGKISNVVVNHSLHPLFDAEVVRVILAMPDWIPGKEKGKAVPVHMGQPVSFR